MDADLSNHAKGLIGVMRLWANTSTVTQFLPQDLARLNAQQPGLRIKLNEADSRGSARPSSTARTTSGIFERRRAVRVGDALAGGANRQRRQARRLADAAGARHQMEHDRRAGCGQATGMNLHRVDLVSLSLIVAALVLADTTRGITEASIVISFSVNT